MTTTVTAPAARRAAGKYQLLLEDLAAEPNRAQRARILDDMADVTDDLADQARGRATRGDEHGDTLSWLETGTLLRQLAAAERGATIVIAIPLDDEDDGEDGGDFTDWDTWARVAAAATRTEYDEAITTVLELLAAFPVPPFALRQLATAAVACSSGRPAAYPAVA